MKLLTNTILLLLFSLFSISLFSQETDFEVNIADDSLNIWPIKFLNKANDNTFIGLVKIAPLFGDLKYYTSFLYSINEEGDTLSKSFAKEDSICSYGNIINITKGEPGYFLNGLIRSLDTNTISVIFTRLDTNLNIVWEKIIKFTDDYKSMYTEVLELEDSSYLYCCSAADSMYLINLGYYGDILRFKVYGGDSAGQVQSLTYNSDSSAFWLHNEWAYYTNGSKTSSCIELNEELEQTKVYFYESNYGWPFTSKHLPDGSLITAGCREYLWPPDIEENQIAVYKYNSNFTKLYSVYLTDPDTISWAGDVVSLDYYYPNCIYVAGTHDRQIFNGIRPNWFYVVKLNDTLGIEYEKYTGGNDYYIMFSVLATSDGGVLLAGTCAEVNTPIHERNGYIIKLDSAGCVTNLDENSGIQIKEALVYPNPGIEKLMVRAALKNCTFKLYNTSGAKVLSQSLESHITQIVTSDLKTGTYVYVIEQNNRVVESGKWIKQ